MCYCSCLYLEINQPSLQEYVYSTSSSHVSVLKRVGNTQQLHLHFSAGFWTCSSLSLHCLLQDVPNYFPKSNLLQEIPNYLHFKSPKPLDVIKNKMEDKSHFCQHNDRISLPSRAGRITPFGNTEIGISICFCLADLVKLFNAFI